jgi:hypothetical protein
VKTMKLQNFEAVSGVDNMKPPFVFGVQGVQIEQQTIAPWDTSDKRVFSRRNG